VKTKRLVLPTLLVELTIVHTVATTLTLLLTLVKVKSVTSVQELQDNIAKIASWVSSQKAGFDAQKSGYDAIAAHLAEETDPDVLADLRNTLDSKIAELKVVVNADYNTAGQNAQSLNSNRSFEPTHSTA
jgi:hypothetical protein